MGLHISALCGYLCPMQCPRAVGTSGATMAQYVSAGLERSPPGALGVRARTPLLVLNVAVCHTAMPEIREAHTVRPLGRNLCPKPGCLFWPMLGAFTLLLGVVPVFGHYTFAPFLFLGDSGNYFTCKFSTPSTLRRSHMLLLWGKSGIFLGVYSFIFSSRAPPPPPPSPKCANGTLSLLWPSN